jgi:hypothetical protein
MSLTALYEEARAALGLGEAEEDAAAVKRAYRRALAAHPPDVDADGFRRIRDAYEVLKDPWARAEDLLIHPLPAVPPPAAPAAAPAAPRGATAVAVLRLVALHADPDAWAAAPRKPRRKPKGAP